MSRQLITCACSTSPPFLFHMFQEEPWEHYTPCSSRRTLISSIASGCYDLRRFKFVATVRPGALAMPAPPPPNQTRTHWILAGPTSGIPNIDPATATSTRLYDQQPCDAEGLKKTQGCRVLAFPRPKSDSNLPEPLLLTPADLEMHLAPIVAEVLIFQYRGKFHAIEHSCPHSSYPLSRGNVGDIEDFGIVLSASIRCPKHGWDFDLFTGQSEKGRYRLRIWEVEVRDEESGEPELWVRRKNA